MKPNQSDTAVLFASLKPGTLDALLKSGIRRHYEKGETIYARGDPGNSAFFIQSGRVEISVTSINGRKSVLNYMDTGDVIGEVAMLDGGERSADATALSDVSGVSVPRDLVFQLLTSDPDALIAMIGELCAKVRNASEMFEMQRKLSGQARLASIILRIADRWGVAGDDGAIYLGNNFTQSELGDFAGLSRENVNRYLTNWLADGLLEQRAQDRRLFIIDRERLESISGV